MSHVFPSFTARSLPSVQAFRMALSVQPRRLAASSAVTLTASDLLPMIPDSAISVPAAELDLSSSRAAAAFNAESTPIVSVLSRAPPPLPELDWESPRTIKRRMGSATAPGTTTVPSGRIRWANCTSLRGVITIWCFPVRHPPASRRSAANMQQALESAGRSSHSES